MSNRQEKKLKEFHQPTQVGEVPKQLQEKVNELRKVVKAIASALP
jgi:hypothetical protein